MGLKKLTNATKKMEVVLAVSLLMGLCACGKSAAPAEDTSVESTEQEYPEIAYINNENYYKTDKICEMVPRRMPDGIIETYVEKEIMPDSPQSANFGSEQEKVEYMFLEDGQLIVHVGENWYYCEQK